MSTETNDHTIGCSTDLENESRRDFLKQSAGLTFCFALGGLLGCEKAEDIEQGLAVSNKDYSANVWVNISADGKIRIYSAADEMVDSNWYRQVTKRADRLVARMRAIQIDD